MIASIKWSVDDYHLMVQSGVLNNRACELIEGEIVVRCSAPTQAGACRLPSAGEALQSLLANPQSGLSPQRACPHVSPIHRFTNDSIAEYLRGLLVGKAKVFESHPITLDNLDR